MSENTIRNDGKDVRFPESADGKRLRLQTVDGKEYSIEIRLGWYGTNVVRLTSDFRVQISGFTLSEPQNRDFIVAAFEELGFVFEEDNPRSRVESLRDEHGDLRRGWKNVMAMAGYPDPNDRMTEGYETTPDGLVYATCNRQRHPSVAPVLAHEVRREAAILIATANRWLHENLRSFKRAVKLTPFEAVQLYMRAKNHRVSVIEVKLGDTVELPWQGSSYFGSGGGWGTFTVYGEVSTQSAQYRDNGFVVSGTKLVTLDKGPAVIFTEAGDNVNGGRVFYRKLFVVHPIGELAERAKKVLPS